MSGLEMAQNSQRLSWTPAEVDAKLKGIMAECYKVRNYPCYNSCRISGLIVIVLVVQICLDAGSKHSGEDLSSGNVLPSLLSGANVAGFIKVADAMKQQGDWW